MTLQFTKHLGFEPWVQGESLHVQRPISRNAKSKSVYFLWYRRLKFW